jgi:hypothetical protein
MRNGSLYIEQYDIGPACEKFFGDSDRERSATFTKEQTEKFKKAIGAETDEELFKFLKQRFGNNEGYDQMQDFCEEHGIKPDYFSY